VTGHIDDTGVIKKRLEQKNYVELQIVVRKNLKPFLVPKGSVCIDGVSLTVGKVAVGYFSVHLIPFTLQKTILGQKCVGDKVNIEADLLAKYMLKQNRK
jgi:riboflavin synthase